MFINFDSMFEPYEVDIETYIEDKMVNKQTNNTGTTANNNIKFSSTDESNQKR